MNAMAVRMKELSTEPNKDRTAHRPSVIEHAPSRVSPRGVFSSATQYDDTICRSIDAKAPERVRTNFAAFPYDPQAYAASSLPEHDETSPYSCAPWLWLTRCPIKSPFRMHLTACMVAVLMILSPMASQAKMVIPIPDPNMAKMPVAIPDFMTPQGSPLSGAELAGILRNDLLLTGLFTIVPPPQGPMVRPDGEPNFDAWSQAGVQALILGSFQVKGDELILEARLFDVALKKMELGKRYKAHTKDHRQVVHKFGDRVMETLTDVPGCFTSQIAFVRDTPPKELFVMDFDGHNCRQVSRTNSINLSPEWSPDGRSLLFTSYINRNPDLWFLDLGGSGIRPISSRRGINAAARWSPGGNTIALSLSVEGTPKIFLINPEGHIIKRLTNGRGNDISPSWSPDGSAIAYVSDQAGMPHIYIVPVQGGQPRRVTFETNYNTDPDWSPRGDLLAFTARVEGRFQICTIRTDGTDFRVITKQGSNQDPSWSPDGRMIAFTSDRDGGRRIYIMDALGGIQVPVSPIPGKAPAWSRNSR